MNIENYEKKGYKIKASVVIGEINHITMEKPKSISFIEGLLIIFGMVLIPLFGVGFILLLLAILNYFMRKNELVTLKYKVVDKI